MLPLILGVANRTILARINDINCLRALLGLTILCVGGREGDKLISTMSFNKRLLFKTFARSTAPSLWDSGKGKKNGKPRPCVNCKKW